jgi:hypothetical protein
LRQQMLDQRGLLAAQLMPGRAAVESSEGGRVALGKVGDRRGN